VTESTDDISNLQFHLTSGNPASENIDPEQSAMIDQLLKLKEHVGVHWEWMFKLMCSNPDDFRIICQQLEDCLANLRGVSGHL
jgi:hypothetical protein